MSLPIGAMARIARDFPVSTINIASLHELYAVYWSWQIRICRCLFVISYPLHPQQHPIAPLLAGCVDLGMTISTAQWHKERQATFSFRLYGGYKWCGNAREPWGWAEAFAFGVLKISHLGTRWYTNVSIDFWNGLLRTDFLCHTL